jgi:hypothetical protein
LEDGDALPEPEIADDLETALEQFRAIETDLRRPNTAKTEGPVDTE